MSQIVLLFPSVTNCQTQRDGFQAEGLKLCTIYKTYCLGSLIYLCHTLISISLLCKDKMKKKMHAHI